MIRILALALLAGPAFADCATVQTPQGFYVRVDPTCPLAEPMGGPGIPVGLIALDRPAPERPEGIPGYNSPKDYAKVSRYVAKRGYEGGSRK